MGKEKIEFLIIKHMEFLGQAECVKQQEAQTSILGEIYFAQNCEFKI